MSAEINISGVKFGSWLAMYKSELKINNKTHWVCRCECGVIRPVSQTNLVSGGSASCGCKKKEILSAKKKTHGMSSTRTYKIWKGMIKRCVNKNSSGFHKYGGRGISVCSRWIHSFENFLADMGECPSGLSLERICNNGNYAPENCRWATNFEQSQNRRNTVRFEGKTLREWESLSGISYSTLKRRLLKNGTIYTTYPNAIRSDALDSAMNSK